MMPLNAGYRLPDSNNVLMQRMMGGGMPQMQAPVNMSHGFSPTGQPWGAPPMQPPMQWQPRPITGPMPMPLPPQQAQAPNMPVQQGPQMPLPQLQNFARQRMMGAF